MIDKQKVCDYLKNIFGVDDQELNRYDLLIDNEISSISASLVDENYQSDERLIPLAGTRIYYKICLSKFSDDDVVSFSAGDISITQNNDCLARAKELVELAYKDCICLLKDDNFAFLGV